jgi:hypothetical protein
LTIRQALAKSTLEGQVVKAAQMKHVCTEAFIRLQRALLPATSEEDIQEFVSYLLHEAIALRDAMTVEQAVYRCYVVANGSSFNPAVMQIQPGEPTEGDVIVCMFPGVVREHIGGSGDTSGHVPNRVTVSVVKAVVKLNTAFGKKPESAQESAQSSQIDTEDPLRDLSADAEQSGEAVDNLEKEQKE